jgi:hypothetical protein
MAGRPRTPAKILELRGAFKKDPQRRRVDAEGAGPFSGEPPTHLAQTDVPAWRYVVARLPKVAMSSSEEIAVEVTAKLLSQFWAGNLGVITELRQWLGKLGMTLTDRAKIPGAPPSASDNPFAGL